MNDEVAVYIKHTHTLPLQYSPNESPKPPHYITREKR